jgi:hypothetical protein
MSVKLSLLQALKPYMVVRSHIVKTVGSGMAVRSALHTGCALLPKNFFSVSDTDRLLSGTRACHSVPEWHMKMLDFIKLPVRKVHLHKISNDNGVKSTKFCHIQKSNSPEHSLVKLQHS